MPIRLEIIGGLLAMASVCSAAETDLQWGALKGRFLVDGTVPVPEAVKLGPDPVCHAAKPVDESVLIGKEGGLQNVVVYVRVPRRTKLPLPPSAKPTNDQPMEMTNKQCAFVPRITLLRTGQPLVVKNDDPTAHNTKFDLLKNTPLNQLIAGGEKLERTFDKAESLPLPVSCNIHPHMRGYVLIRDDPYMAVTNAKGEFIIKQLPAGEHEFQFWHETGYLKNVKFTAGKTAKASDRRGRAKLTIPADGELDLGEVRLPATLLMN